jgi:hypothetical protein
MRLEVAMSTKGLLDMTCAAVLGVQFDRCEVVDVV